MISWDKDADGIVVLTLDDPNQGANTMNELYARSMAEVVDRLATEVEALDTLRQQQWDRWRQEAQKADQDRLDEVGLRRWQDARGAVGGSRGPQ